jgi:hypothetical protein
VDADWADPDPDDAERQLRRALEAARDPRWRDQLTTDRARLRQRLDEAQAEVLATATRLIDIARRHEVPAFNELPDQAEAKAREIEARYVPLDLTPVEPNPLFFALVALVYSLYKRLPRRVRRQVNIDIKRLRGETVYRWERLLDESSD